MQEMYETWVQSLGWEDSLEEGMATRSSVLPGESRGQRSLAGYRVGHDWSDLAHTTFKGLFEGTFTCNLWIYRALQGRQVDTHFIGEESERAIKPLAWGHICDSPVLSPKASDSGSRSPQGEEPMAAGSWRGERCWSRLVFPSKPSRERVLKQSMNVNSRLFCFTTGKSVWI